MLEGRTSLADQSEGCSFGFQCGESEVTLRCYSDIKQTPGSDRRGTQRKVGHHLYQRLVKGQEAGELCRGSRITL